MIGQSGNTKFVLDYLKSGKSLTAREAFRDYDIQRLAAIICTLRQAGYEIKSVKVENSKNDVRYFM